jgi:Xaa-Pro aminopeptidase
MLINLERARSLMEKKGLDALIATHPTNVYYVSEFPKHPVCAFPPTPCLCDTPTYAILPLEKDIEPAIILPMIQVDLLFSSDTWIKDFRYYGSFSVHISEDLDPKKLSSIELKVAEVYRSIKAGEDIVKVLKETLDDKGLSKGHLGLDEGGLTPKTFQRITKTLRDAEILYGTNVFYEIRLVKTQEEIDRMRRAAEINVKAIESVCDAVKVGVSEKELWEIWDSEVRKEGAHNVYPVIGGGGNSGLTLSPGFKPSERPLEKGDVIRMDNDLIYKYYFSDVARSVVIGEPSEKVKKYYNALLAGHNKAEEAIKPGIKPYEIFNIAINTIRKSGMPFYNRPHHGHGIGLECYNPLMSISSVCNIPLEEGMTVNLEAPYYAIGVDDGRSIGFNLENTILVTKSGHEILSKANKELLIL